MKKMLLTWMILMIAAFSYAAGSEEQPQFSAPTPAENAGISEEKADLEDSEKESWQKLRAERSKARQQILSNMREGISEEKREMHEEMRKERDENSRYEKKSQKKEIRERDEMKHDRESRPGKGHSGRDM